MNLQPAGDAPVTSSSDRLLAGAPEVAESTGKQGAADTLRPRPAGSGLRPTRRGRPGARGPDGGTSPAEGAPARFDLFAAFASRTTRRPGARALVAYAIASLVASWPIWPGDPGRVPWAISEDVVQTVWFLEWTPYALLHGHNLFDTAYVNYPHGVDLAQNTGIPLLGLLTAPLTLAVNPIASLNLLRFLAFTLSAYSAYWVLRKFTTWAPAAFAGGLLYGFSPYMVTQGQYHLDLSFVPLPPLILYLVYEIVVAQRARPARQGAVLGAVAVAQYYISAEVLATTALLSLAGVLLVSLVGIRHVPGRVLHACGGLAVAAMVLLPLIGYPLWISMHGPAHYIGPAQGYHNVYNADLLGPFLPTSAQLVAPARLAAAGSRLVGSNVDENGSYLSLPLILLAGLFLVRDRRRLVNGIAAALALVAFVLSLGPRLIVNGVAVFPRVHLPFAAIARLPLLENILAVRFSLYVATFVALIVARGIDAEHLRAVARRKIRRRRSPFQLGMLVLGLASAVALVPRWPYVSYPNRLHWAETPAGLAMVPTGSVTLTYPYPTSFADDAMFWQALSGMRFRLLGSYALVRAQHGHATVAPAVLQPAVVEGMLVNSITIRMHPHPLTDPSLPRVYATPRTITPRRVYQLRTFIRDNHVQTVIIQMGRPDSAEIATWFRRALGPPTRAGAGGEIWLHAGARARPQRV